jgi:hypothetical protein
MIDPPVAMLAPESVYQLFYWLLAAGMVGALCWLTYVAVRRGSLEPVAALLGGLLCGFGAAPIFDRLTLVWFPSNIPAAFVTAFGMRDPIFDALGYALFFGLGGYQMSMMLRSGKGARAVWYCFLAWGLTDLLLEIPFLHYGLYKYYGDQPLLIGGFPAYWVFMNGLVSVLTGTLMNMAGEAQREFSFGSIVWVGLCPVFASALLMIPIAPVAVALNSEAHSWARVLAALLSIGISLAALSLLVRRAQRPIRDHNWPLAELGAQS